MIVMMTMTWPRWSSIMNMAQFANKVIGQPVTNWDVSHNNNNNNNNDTYNNNINEVISEPVTDKDIIFEKSYWKNIIETTAQASGTTLGFARGNVGFLAVGDLGKDFNTGLPVNMKTTITSIEPITKTENNNNTNNNVLFFLIISFIVIIPRTGSTVT